MEITGVQASTEIQLWCIIHIHCFIQHYESISRVEQLSSIK